MSLSAVTRRLCDRRQHPPPRIIRTTGQESHTGPSDQPRRSGSPKKVMGELEGAWVHACEYVRSMDNATSPRPILLLDIDGTVSPLRLFEDPRRAFTVHAAGYWEVFVYDDLRDRIGQLIVDGVADVFWLTDWEQPYCDELSDALRWPRMQRLPASSDGEGWWKESVVRSYLDRGHRVIWADDQASSRASGSIVGDPGTGSDDDFERPDGVLREDERLLLISPNRRVGLTQRDLDTIEVFLSAEGITT